jgi:hypothetical protein
MRAGRMNSRLRILDGDGVELGRIWADVRPPLEVGEQSGLRESGQTKVLVRPRAILRPGLFLEGHGYLFVIDGLGDRLSRRQDLHLSCTRLVGRDGVYRRHGGAESPVRVHVSRNQPHVGLSGQVMDYRYRVDIPALDQPAPWQPGDVILLDGAEYPLTGLAEDGDDGTVITFTS